MRGKWSGMCAVIFVQVRTRGDFEIASFGPDFYEEH